MIPGSKTPAHIADNIDIFDFELDGADLASMVMLDRGEPFYARSPEKFAMYATWRPDVEGQK